MSALASRAARASGALAVLLLAAPAWGETSVGRFEIAPFIGYRVGGDFELADAGEVDLAGRRSFAAALDLRRDPLAQYELYYSRQATRLERGTPLGGTEVEVEYLHVGGTLIVAEAPRIAPYILATLGATRFATDAPGARSDTRFSLAFGAGLRVPLGARLALRLEGRIWHTFVDTDTAFFCASGELGGVCAIRASGGSFWQYAASAGIAIALR